MSVQIVCRISIAMTNIVTVLVHVLLIKVNLKYEQHI